jgi:hypothetical protein
MHAFRTILTETHFVHKGNKIMLLKANYSNFSTKMF